MSATNCNSSLRPTKTTQKAMQYDVLDNKVHINEIPIPTPGRGKILVKIACASLCHSDIMLFEPSIHGPLFGNKPVTMGHEASGTVVELGEGVTNFNIGDPVGFLPAMECCFECGPCRKTNNTWCEKGCTLQGYEADGYFQEYAVVDARGAMILPAGIDVVEAAPLFCAGVTAYHSVADAECQPGDWMAIIGCSGLGDLAIQYAKAMQLKVIAIDTSDTQLEQAKAWGADHTLNPQINIDYVSSILSITGGGVKAGVNFVSSKESYDAMPQMMKPGMGTIMVVGIPMEPLQFSALDIALGKYKVKGSNNGTSYNMREAIEFSANHGIKPLLTYFSLEQMPEMIEVVHLHQLDSRLGVIFD
ncbi:GroES-like protein [Venturia nashicola]|uniref:GroES-like protein n=1 Tax=Venturia nashicola TaxID=86259 RepID=A0A4Z1P629_9PEZI|nr:GroES-like protein [Venturia nashicola]TLD36241.1 GroES-like protein [Venturia nashicola]